MSQASREARQLWQSMVGDRKEITQGGPHGSDNENVSGDWSHRPWLAEEGAGGATEQFLRSLPCINAMNAKRLASAASLRTLLTADSNALQALCPGLMPSFAEVSTGAVKKILMFYSFFFSLSLLFFFFLFFFICFFLGLLFEVHCSCRRLSKYFRWKIESSRFLPGQRQGSPWRTRATRHQCHKAAFRGKEFEIQHIARILFVNTLTCM